MMKRLTCTKMSEWIDFYYDCEIYDFPDVAELTKYRELTDKAAICRKNNEELLAKMELPEYRLNPYILLMEMEKNNEVIEEADKIDDVLLKGFFRKAMEMIGKYSRDDNCRKKMMKNSYNIIYDFIAEKEYSYDEDFIEMLTSKLEIMMIELQAEHEVWG